MNKESVLKSIISHLDKSVEQLTQEDYLWVLEELQADVMGKVDCVREELDLD